MDKISILFVCLGNICRSPMAEGVFVSLVETRGVSAQFHIDSAGTSAYHAGEKPDKRMRLTAKDNGLSLEHQRSRQVELSDYDDFDYIIAMDRSNLANLEYQKPPQCKAKLVLMRSFDPHPEDGNVPDPYFGGDEGFRNVYEILVRSATNLLDQLQNDHQL